MMEFRNYYLKTDIKIILIESKAFNRYFSVLEKQKYKYGKNYLIKHRKRNFSIY